MIVMGLEQDLTEINCLREEMVKAYRKEDFGQALAVSQKLDQLILKVQQDFPKDIGDVPNQVTHSLLC